ncbi:hypothetical protein E3N88_20618 [Mikania micrantha]|uniref:Uncharacterized protein n=1 Tax=Mikania micrantha TaxID=192012 RepID=A0A5N6NK35_9ASTR|nr:hypothetical protein E3N88_20618 [Mikania micrantha]
MLPAYETLEECDDEENKADMIHVKEIDGSFNNQLSEIGHKITTSGWFVLEEDRECREPSELASNKKKVLRS